MKKSDCTPEEWEQQLAKWRDWHRANETPTDKQRKADWLKRDRAANPEKYRRKNREWYAKTKERDRGKWRARSRKWKSENKERNLDLQREWRRRNPEKVRTKLRKRALAKYGLTPESFEVMRSAQCDACAICRCGFSSNPREVHVDHCHLTGATRELLCGSCNLGLGKFHENPDTLRRAADYIEKHRAK